MTTGRRVHHTYAQYLELLGRCPFRLEYCAGEIYAFAAGTPAHDKLCASATRLLDIALRGRCRVLPDDVRVHVEAAGLTTFPDVAVVCGNRNAASVDRDAVVNPTIVVEVTTRATVDYDRFEKLRHYKQIDTLNAIVLVAHDQKRVTLVERSIDGWTESIAGPGERVVLASPALSLGVDELYGSVALDPG